MQPETSKLKKRRRTEALRIRLSAEERDAVDAAAEAAGVGVCTFARVLVVNAVGKTPTPAPRPRRTPSEPARNLAKVIGEIARIGNNLNQLARAANTGFDLDPAIVTEATAELRRLRETIVASHDEGTSS
ncbi:MobC family plasmid mobilization relaxosome protein [Bradyrhizobium manausense]|uniref:MobC family plasmid mobilization relaxosome protein n=1 Tax=Bradyrhizobium manausense TaxID=989370 RepID=UPI001BA7E5F2|nr:MobC family plasmid mobilization relaxosome protein [Bradyrhizobium manausense]